MRIFSILILLVVLSACASPTANRPAPTPVSPPPTALPPLVGTWLGSAVKPDGTTASIQLTLKEADSTISIEPLTKTTKLTMEQNSATFKFSAVGDSHDAFKQIEFTGAITKGSLQNGEGQPG